MDHSNKQSMMLALEPDDAPRLALLCGEFDRNLRTIEGYLGVKIQSRGNQFQVRGAGDNLSAAREVLHTLYRNTEQGKALTEGAVRSQLESMGEDREKKDAPRPAAMPDFIELRRRRIEPLSAGQKHYIRGIHSDSIHFGIGIAGTGKTHLAVACAAEALENHRCQRIVLTRPAVEAGENLGFLPGDLHQKINPYLQPLHDALYQLLGRDKVSKLMAQRVLEVVPLAYMRGRTLSDAFVILDEAQNTTPSQLKMFLTRIGYGTRAVINGDPTQTDLPARQASGLAVASEKLKNIKGISFTHFEEGDVVRHPLVKKIIQAWK